MRIVIDAASSLMGGARTYLKYWLPAIGELDRQNQYLVFMPKLLDELRLKLPDNFSINELDYNVDAVLKRKLWLQVELPQLAADWHADLLYSVSNETSLLVSCPTVVAVRNLNPFTKWSWRSEGEIQGVARRWLKEQIRRQIVLMSMRKARKVIVPSNFALNQISSAYPWYRDKMVTIYHGVDERFRSEKVPGASTAIERRLATVKTYILAVSTISPHKNYPTLIQAYADLVSNNQLATVPDLVVVGSIGSEHTWQQLQSLVAAKNVQQRVHFLGSLPHEDLVLIYRRACAFVMLSLVESFGMPLLEAMATGLPIVASSQSAIPEICLDAALYVDPMDTSEVSRKLEVIIDDARTRHNLIANAKRRADVFSWRNTVEKTLAVFSEVSG